MEEAAAARADESHAGTQLTHAEAASWESVGSYPRVICSADSAAAKAGLDGLTPPGTAAQSIDRVDTKDTYTETAHSFMAKNLVRASQAAGLDGLTPPGTAAQSIDRIDTKDTYAEMSHSFMAKNLVRDSVDAGVEAAEGSIASDDTMPLVQSPAAGQAPRQAPPQALPQEKPPTRGSLPENDQYWVGNVLLDLAKNLTLSPRADQSSPSATLTYPLGQAAPACGLHLEEIGDEEMHQASVARQNRQAVPGLDFALVVPDTGDAGAEETERLSGLAIASGAPSHHEAVPALDLRGVSPPPETQKAPWAPALKPCLKGSASLPELPQARHPSAMLQDLANSPGATMRQDRRKASKKSLPYGVPTGPLVIGSLPRGSRKGPGAKRSGPSDESRVRLPPVKEQLRLSTSKLLHKAALERQGPQPAQKGSREVHQHFHCHYHLLNQAASETGPVGGTANQ